MNNPKGMDLNERLAHLEEVNRFRMKSLDMIRELSGFQESINQLADPGGIMDKCRDQVLKLIKVKALAFYLIDEQTSDFNIHRCYPRENQGLIEGELDRFIEDGTFSRAVLEKKIVTASSRDFSAHFFFHALATVSRVRGMCVAVLDGSSRQVPEAAFELVSILMTHCANGLESYELYNRLKKSNHILEEKVAQLSLSQTSLRKEVAAHEKTLQALGTSESQYRLLAETAREIIMTVSAKGQVTYMNQSGLALVQYTMEEVVSMGISKVLTGFDALGKIGSGSIENFSACLVNKSGQDIPLEVSMVPVQETHGNPGFLIVGRDITERLQAEKEKASLETNLWQARKMESIGLLASGTAHDFNNLLTVIFNYTDLSRESMPRDHKAHGYLKHVETASRRAMDLAKKLYTIGREDRHETHKIDLKALIKETLSLLRSSLGKTLTLETRIHGDSLVVEAEETRIQQVLMNLITNAAHSMEKGTIQVGGKRIQVEQGPEQERLGIAPGPFIRLWVKDTGPGIDSEIMPHIFEPYFSTKEGRDNAGLGLAVVHGIVTNYQGAIEVESVQEDGAKGTCFYIYLPQAS